MFWRYVVKRGDVPGLLLSLLEYTLASPELNMSTKNPGGDEESASWQRATTKNLLYYTR